jgi:hypothetical protein
MMAELDELAWKVGFVDSMFSDMLHIPELMFSCLCLWLANKTLALLPCQLEP